MEKQEIERRIAAGRLSMKYTEEMEFGDFVSDQDQKLPMPPLWKEPKSDKWIALNRNFEEMEMDRDLLSVMRKRTSTRVFAKEAMTIDQLSFLLWSSQGIEAIRGNYYGTLRTVPSGGSRHGFETYLLVQNVEGLQPGYYHYLAQYHGLECIKECVTPEDVLCKSVVGQDWVKHAQVIFFWSFIPYRCEWRYGIYAHRPALMDAGHVGQNHYLGCAALGLGTCCLAAYDQKTCNEMFELDGEEEYIVYVAPVGTLKKEAQPREYFYDINK